MAPGSGLAAIKRRAAVDMGDDRTLTTTFSSSRLL
jgi:hypothetical protein